MAFFFCSPFFNFILPIYKSDLASYGFHLNHQPNNTYFLFTSDDADNPYVKIGFQPGDIITHINTVSLNEVNFDDNAGTRYDRFKNGEIRSEQFLNKIVVMSVLRNDRLLDISVQNLTTNLMWEIKKFGNIRLMIGILFLMISLLVVLSGNLEFHNRLFFVTGWFAYISIGIGVFDVTDKLSVMQIRSITGNISSLIAAASLLHFYFIFPARKRIVLNNPKLIPALYIVSALVGGYYFYTHFIVSPEIGWAFLILNVVQNLYFLGGTVILIVSLVRSNNYEEKVKLRWMSSGLVLGLFPYLILYNFPIVMDFGYEAAEWAILFLAIVPIFFTIAIIRYNLFDIDIIIKRSTAYSIVSLILIAGYLAIVSVIGIIFSHGLDFKFDLTTAVSVLILAALFNPLRKKVNGYVQKLFDRDKYDYQTSILNFARTSTNIISLPDLLMALMNELYQNMKITKVTIYIRNEDHYILSDFEGFGDTELYMLDEVKYDHDFAYVFVGREYIELENLTTKHPALNHFITLGVKILVPLHNKGELVGFVCLWEKRSQIPYDSEDIELLITLASQFSITLDNAIAYSTIKNLNATLEEKVKQRTEELVQALNQLKSTQGQLVQAEKLGAMGTMIAGVAHEINNPLNMISASVHPLQHLLDQLQIRLMKQEEILSEIRKESVPDNIRKQLDEMDKLHREFTNSEIEGNLKIFIKSIENGTIKAARVISVLRNYLKMNEQSKTPTEINSVLSNIEILTQLERGSEIVIEKIFSPLPPILMNESQLQQVFMNLTKNAIQATRHNQGKITFTTLHEGSNIVVKIRDNGSGIPKKIQSKIFDPFFTTQPTGSGYGLGLSVAYEIVRNSGGDIRFISSEENGTEFIVTLPANS